MRWLVEVSAIGKGDPQSFCVEAETWQRALQLVRAHRGETSPMSGFSIELLEAGYRAVDPVARLRFVVKRTTDTAALTPLDNQAAAPAAASAGSAAPGATTKPSATAPAAPAAAGPKPAVGSKPAVAAGPAQAVGSKPAASAAVGSKPAVGAKPAAAAPGAAAPRPGGTSAAPATATKPSAPRALPASLANSTDLDTTVKTVDPLDVAGNASRNVFESATVEVPVVPVPAPVAPQGAPAEPVPDNAAAVGSGLEVLSRREHSPTESLPLSYREYAFLVQAGTKEGAAVGLLLAQLELVQAALGTAQTGKLVQLAVFDERFEGKASKPPLATLTWKDWRGDPTVHFPRRAAPGSKASSAPAGAPAAAAPPAAVKQTLVEPVTTLDDTRAIRPAEGRTEEPLRIVVPADLERTAERPAPPARPGRGAATLLGVPQLVEPLPPNAPAPAPHTLASASPASASPASASPAPRPASVPPPAPATRPASVPPPAPASRPASVPPPAPAARPQSVPPPAPVARPQSVPPPAPVARPQSVPPPAPAPAPAGPLVLPRFTPGPGAVAMVPPAPAPAPARSDAESPFTPPPGNVTVVIPPRSQTGTRVSGDELIATLFEAMHDLHFLQDAIQGADFCLQLAIGVIPSRAGYAHFFDVEKREFVLVRAKGEDTEDLVGKRHLEAEPLLSAAVRTKKAILKDANDALTSRYMTLGGATSVVLCPVFVAGRALAILELVNPSDGAPFTQAEANALTYIAEQFAEFLSSRGLVFDHGRARAAQG
ncbi:MAG: hypothetical protein IPF92_12710 [Myxococcales bacterium]|nr:hypothetical protein [Myxococcales bacterium]